MKATELKYKKTGIDWIPEVPEHWEIVRLKNIVQINADKLSEQTPKNTLINYIDITNVNGDGDILEVQQLKFKDAPSRARRLLKKNDTIISTVRTYLKAITTIRDGNFVGSTGFAVLTPDVERLNPDFLYYYVSSKAFVNKVMVNSVGVAYPAINPTTLACLPFLLPPIEEQNRIVEILNSESAKINRFIQAKQRFIELLKEQRQSIITQAVTKGIDEGVKMKETGIDWMPEVPEHWEIRRLKYLVELYKHNKTQTNSNGYDFKLALENIDSWTGKYVETVNPDFEGEGKYFQNGDVLFGKLRPYLAKAFLPKTKGVCVSEILVFTPNSELITSEFLFQRILTKGFIDIVNGSTYGAKMPRAGWDFIGNMRIAYPPTIEEQKRIVEYIKAETRNIDIAISKAEREIELIKEYREALIAEAVTGKLKV